MQAPPIAAEAPPLPTEIRVRLLPCQPNPAWPDELTTLIRFAKPDKAVPCAACGNRSKKHWTMLVPFRPALEAGFELKKGAEQQPLTLVCSDHPIWPTDRFARAAAPVDAALAKAGFAQVLSRQPPGAFGFQFPEAGELRENARLIAQNTGARADHIDRVLGKRAPKPAA